jgi:hypothetical protein
MLKLLGEFEFTQWWWEDTSGGRVDTSNMQLASPIDLDIRFTKEGFNITSGLREIICAKGNCGA